jgi:hypothetical protein
LGFPFEGNVPGVNDRWDRIVLLNDVSQLWAPLPAASDASVGSLRISRHGVFLLEQATSQARISQHQNELKIAKIMQQIFQTPYQLKKKIFA